MTTSDPKLEKELEDSAKVERTRLAKLLFDRAPGMTSDYKNLIKHTGGLLAASMGFAYSKGISDALKLILKGDNNEKK